VAPAPLGGLDDSEFAGEARSYWSRAFGRFLQHRFAVASLILLVLIFAAGLLASRLAPYGYQEANLHALNSGPSWSHPFGADQLGRDYLSRTLYGIGTSAQVALLVGFIACLIGTLVGALAGYYGGLVDNSLMRLTDLLLTLPVLAVVLLTAAFLHADTAQKAAIVLACLLWTSVARVLRASALALREKEFVDSARASGASDLRIIMRHVLPNAIGPLAAATSLMIATAIVLEVTIAYLGFGFSNLAGLQAKPSIGDVLRQAQTEGYYHWWGITFPGLPIVLIVVAISFLAEGLRDSLDPTSGSSRRFSAKAFRPRRRRLGPALRTRTLQIRAPEWVTLERVRQVARPRWSLPSIVPAWKGARSAYTDSRRRAAMKFGLEALAIAALIGAVAGTLYHFGVHHARSPWATAGSDVQAISRAPGAQTEVAVAVAPDDPQRFFAASNDSVLPQIRVYDSPDGGRTWTSRLGPSLTASTCAWGDPAVALAPGGRQYVAFVDKSICRKGIGLTPYLVVASRAGPNAAWIVRRVAPPAIRDGFDDKPAIAVDGAGRAYVAWSRLLSPTYETTVLSSSVDGGRTWSTPHVVDRKLSSPQWVSAAVGGGALYLAGVDARLGVWLARSADGGRHFTVRQAAPLAVNNAANCVRSGKYLFAQQAISCLGTNPTVTVGRGRTYVTYATLSPNQTWDVGVAVFDAKLGLLWRGRIGPAEQKPADQFWPTSAVDAQTGELWACFYDTTGDSERKQAWFLCSRSQDGRHWAPPVRVSRQPDNAFVLWADAIRAGFGDDIAYGSYPGLAAAAGVAHPMWIDARDRSHLDQEIFTARLPSASLSAPPR
jgi:ABC-type dipeptide/oligopeptide/nickel transport system permease subunit